MCGIVVFNEQVDIRDVVKGVLILEKKEPRKQYRIEFKVLSGFIPKSVLIKIEFEYDKYFHRLRQSDNWIYKDFNNRIVFECWPDAAEKLYNMVKKELRDILTRI